MIKGIEQDTLGLHGDWEIAGSYISAAIQEIATELGGEELAARVGEAAVPEEVLPNPEALKLLEQLYPGSAEQVMTRSEAIQQETHERERAAMQKPIARRYGRAMLIRFTNVFGNPLQRR